MDRIRALAPAHLRVDLQPGKEGWRRQPRRRRPGGAGLRDRSRGGGLRVRRRAAGASWPGWRRRRGAWAPPSTPGWSSTPRAGHHPRARGRRPRAALRRLRRIGADPRRGHRRLLRRAEPGARRGRGPGPRVPRPRVPRCTPSTTPPWSRTPPACRWMAKTTRDFAGDTPLALSPVTLRPRPATRPPPGDDVRRRVDPRAAGRRHRGGLRPDHPLRARGRGRAWWRTGVSSRWGTSSPSWRCSWARRRTPGSSGPVPPTARAA